MKKILLHTCCGPCFLGVFEGIKDKDFEITNFFYNPNIYPKEEYQKRKENLSKVVGEKGTEFLEGEYDPDEYDKSVSGLELAFPKRCESCYKLRLEKTAEVAKQNGFDLFSTTLLVSPYQQHAKLREIGEELALKYNIEFYYQDFRLHFREGQNLARDHEIYRQKYCGCKYSLSGK